MEGPQIQARILLALTDHECPVRLVTAGIQGLLGFRPDQFQSGSVCFRDCVHADDRHLFEGLVSPNTEPATGNANIRLRNAAGRVICVKADYEKRTGEGGLVLLDLLLEDARMVACSDDALLAANFKRLIEHSQEFIYVKNRHHVFLAASPAMVSLTTSVRTADEMVGKTDYDLYPEEVADLSYRLEMQAIDQKRRTNEVQQRTTQDGRRIWIDDRKYPVDDARNAVMGLLGVSPEITMYFEPAARVRESEAALQEAQKIANLGSFDLDLRTKIWKFSPELDRIVGASASGDRTFEEFWALIHPDECRVMRTTMENIFRGEENEFDREYRIIRQNDGAVRWMHTRGRIELDAGGRPARVHGTVQDITEKKQAEDELQESKNLLQLFIERAPAPLAMFDHELRYLAVSGRWIETYSLQGKEILGHSIYESVPDLPESWKEHHRRALSGETIPSHEALFVSAGGRRRWVRRELLPWFRGDGEIGGILILAEDVTRHHDAREHLRLAATVFDHAAEGIVITDREGTILAVNEAFTRITGYTREEVVGKNPRILQSGLQSQEFYEKMWRSLVESGHWSGEIWNRSKNGEIFAEELTITAIQDAEGKTQQYVAHFTDVTEQKERARELERMAYYEPLTGLPNRLLLRDRLQQAIAHTRRHNQMMAVAYLDVDAFGTVNDEYGQETGDRMLSVLAKRLKLALREGDTLAKLGGDEFAAVLLDLRRGEDALPVINRLLRAAARSVRFGTDVLRVSSSIGVVFYSGSAETNGDRLLGEANQAMYQAKLNGRNRYHVLDPVQDVSAHGHRESLQGIRRALHKHEFVLHYQPKVNMRTGKLAGVEALIRWQHPRRGLLTPSAFLPIIENHPLSSELDRWVIDRAMAQMEAWQDAGLQIPISVNLGAQELQQSDFVERLQDLLTSHPGVRPGMLQLEVLETTALQDLARTSEVLETCRQLGVSFALDDFGTGYSSLTYLKYLPTKVLKIDQSFVRDILEDPENLGILEAVLGLAAAFRREVVAEGVETVEHGLRLLQLGCELAQGSGVARPMPADDLPGWLVRWRPDPRWAASPGVCLGNRTLLYACVEHRAWLGGLEAYLQGKRHAPPSLNPKECRFASWLEAERQAGHTHFPAFQAIEELHTDLHQLAMEILEAQVGNRSSESLARLGVLHCLRDEFLERLTSLN